MFQSCLICTDFSDGLDRLVNFVPALIEGGFQKIVFFHSVPLWEEGAIPRVDESKVALARKRLSKASIELSETAEAIQVIVEVESGKPLDTIPRVLKKHPVDVIFIGTPIRSLLQERIFGSTTIGLAKLTSTPLAIIRPQLISTYTIEELNLRSRNLWRSILIPYNDSKAAKYLIDRLKSYAGNRATQQITLIWVVEECRQEALTLSRLKEAEAKLKTVKTDLEKLGWQVDFQVERGYPLPLILEVATNLNISAIAIAADSNVNLFQRAVPSFAEEFLRRSWFPLLFFSSPN
jgi:nucleotide-binding universal stress UspA family protein